MESEIGAREELHELDLRGGRGLEEGDGGHEERIWILKRLSRGGGCFRIRIEDLLCTIHGLCAQEMLV